ncbi:TonB-dependent receptor family protein [Roseateles violae]|uniref:TonB-dependent receptor n=1 Tax=Roseateles violae TaxID=3058042 RepID=A0ABT8DRH0_9BURK|nr:TonB-dependent receptor [Pelomonas sp. PFR6]MDN3920782.1 TonB-dependent receptor [Pelomonas sp. PFR6]
MPACQRPTRPPCCPLRLAAALSALLGAWPAAAQQQEQQQAGAAPTVLAPVVITATRTEAQAFDVPAAISRIGAAEVREGHALINISESLALVPGLLARDRQNYAQDVQIAVRGFGARSSFGIRGVRLYVDGIPATLPDGQGQISNVELGAVGRIEVLRGPFSALYGNSSGGVIQVFSEEGTPPPSLGITALAGSDGTWRLGGQASGAQGPGFAYNLSASRFHTDGYRDHSAAERSLGNAKLTLRSDADTRLTVLANSLALPEAQDPLGLSRAQAEANPRGVDPSAISFNTRKSVNQTQLGLVFERRLDAANVLQATGYGGHRGTEQFQAIPVAAQVSPLSPGGVIDLSRDYKGLDLRWTWKSRLLDGPFSLVGGLAYDQLEEHRRGYQNFVGTTLGVRGALRRDERNDVDNFDQYLQAQWQIAPQWSLSAGLRHSQIDFRSRDAYIVGTNPDDSGSADYSATLPVLGLMYALSSEVHLYATAGRGFETPTLNELAYRSGGATGMNFGLQASRSGSVEAGVKTQWAGWGEASLALFRTDTENEIVTQTNTGGRSTFQNAGATRRSGLELAWAASYWQHLRLQLAATALKAEYREAFQTCTASPCATPNVTVAAGNSLPGIARGSLFAGLGWAPPLGWRGGLELRALSKVYVNDANSDAAAGYAAVAAQLGYAAQLGAWELNAFVRGDNLFDRRYIGSVIVNEGNSRFFEPAPGRSWIASASATLRF